ncbi:hypothetical protein [Pleomorphomonas koreensis]|uniref:hypothetical protein n=1 Tax=Pleomorphomonas koreensis TaxID=257440 RepID=UPI000422869B|nr:hypothetical protein [Pleomorphomonas koreensis]
MTVTSIVVRATALWTGAETEFPTGIQVLERSQLVVSLTPAGGDSQQLTLGLHYSVVLSVGGVATVVPLGAFPAMPGTVSFERDTPMTQDYDPTATDTYDAAGHAAALDRSAMRVAELSQLVEDIDAASIVVAGGASSVPEGAVYVSDGDGGAIAGPTASEIDAARTAAVNAAGTASAAAGAALGAVTGATQAADRAEAAAASVEGYVSYEDEQDLSPGQRAQALENLGLGDLQNALTPLAFTAAAGQTVFDLGMSPSPAHCIVSLNGAWLVGGGADYTIAVSTLTLTTPAAAGDRIAGVAIGSFEVAGALTSAANLADLGNVAVARNNLGLGTAAVLDAGTGANQVLKIGGDGKLPAVDGSRLTGLIFTKSFSSAEQAWTAAALFTIPHGFGVAPKMLRWHLVCKTAEAGFAVGDSVDFVMPAPNAFTYYYGAVWCDATNINVRTTSNLQLQIPHKTTGVATTLTLAGWRWTVEAYA